MLYNYQRIHPVSVNGFSADVR